MSKVEMKMIENGPNMLFVDGELLKAFRRFGVSNNKPFCDEAHARIRLSARPTELRVLDWGR